MYMLDTNIVSAIIRRPDGALVADNTGELTRVSELKPENWLR